MAKKAKQKKQFKPLSVFTSAEYPSRDLPDVLPHREADKPSPPDLWQGSDKRTASEAQRNNTNALRSGARIQDHAAVLKKLSRKYPNLAQRVDEYRGEIEAELMRQFGEITESDRKAIVEICRHQLTELVADFLVAEGKVRNVVYQLGVAIKASEQRLQAFDRLFNKELRAIQKRAKG